MKKRKSKKEKKISKKSPVEEELESKVEIISVKKEIPKKDFMEELDSLGIISSGEFNQILKSEMKLSQLENIPVGTSLEGGLIFAPRIKDSKDAEGKVYSDMKYNQKYDEVRYSEKTPGVYAGKETSSKKESSKGSGNSGDK